MKITALLVSTVIAAGLTPATTAAAATETDYCMAIITTGQSWCAATEAELDSIRARQMGSRAIAPAATSHLVDLYDAANRTGAYYALYGTACDTNADIDGSYTLPSSWNDRISSFQGFGNCETRLYQNGDYTGSTYGPIFATDDVGATMNDETSAVRVY
jgi:hypothetical protein